MAPSVLHVPPDRIERQAVPVMERTTADELHRIQTVWPWFEELVGLRGRRMFARVDDQAATYTVCTPIKEDDDPARLGLRRGVLPGGPYLRGRLVGEPPRIYERIGAGMAELEGSASRDPSRPLIEFYRRRDQMELWVPVAG